MIEVDVIETKCKCPAMAGNGLSYKHDAQASQRRGAKNHLLALRYVPVSDCEKCGLTSKPFNQESGFVLSWLGAQLGGDA
jgi:hypothetical protein